jgi:DNA-binding transcriptional MerR regulator
MDTDEETRGRLRIGELAALTATTPRAIRHYHAVGLLAEPERDGSGYRRYGPRDVVALVRIRRLRGLGMPLDGIRRTLAGERREPDDLPAALRSLARDLAAGIDRLAALRARVLDLAASGALDAPAESWAAQLQGLGLLDEGAALPAREERAAELLDALHPEGIDGVIADTSGVLSDPARVARLGALLRRFQALPDDAADELVDGLAAEYAAALPRPVERPPAVDVETMDALLGDRLSPSQRRCMLRVRELLETA